VNLDTKYLSGDIAKDVQFIKDNLTNDDVNMIRAQLQFIMSVGNGRLEERKDI
jgi:hypothetical protein